MKIKSVLILLFIFILAFLLYLWLSQPSEAYGAEFEGLGMLCPPSPVQVVHLQRKALYPIRGNWWTGCDSWVHLTKGEHRGKYSPAWLQSLSWDELQSLHSDDHERRVKMQYVVRPASPAYMRATPARRCPNGRCPW